MRLVQAYSEIRCGAITLSQRRFCCDKPFRQTDPTKPQRSELVIDTVPHRVTEQVLAFCRTIAPGRPTFISSKPSTDAQPSACFDNVARKVERAGGSVASGWVIWSVPGIYFEAEHHGVWRNRRGELIDVSPQPNSGRRILFLPDPGAPYDPLRHRSNILRPASDDPRAIELVELANRRNQIQDAYRQGGNRIARFTLSDQRDLDEIQRRLQRLLLELTGKA